MNRDQLIFLLFPLRPVYDFSFVADGDGAGTASQYVLILCKCARDGRVIEAVQDMIPPTTIPSPKVMLSMCFYDSDDECGKYYLGCCL